MGRRGQRKPRPLGDPDPQGFPALQRAFFEWMRVRGYSEATIESRSVYLGFFAAWCAERAITRPKEVTKPILERYQRYLYHYRNQKTGRAMSFRSQHTRLVPLRAFFRWLAKSNYLLSNPASELELPKLEHRLPKHVLTAGEADQVMNGADLKDQLGVRDRAILETLYSTGIRRMELVHLRLYDLDVERGTLVVRQGKGKKDRMVPIGERALAWIDKYVTEVRPSILVEPDEGFLFLTHLGESFTPNRLTQLVRGYVDRAAIGKRGACHLFRHTMATLMLEGGADVRFIQEMLGHAKLETTQIYTQVSIRKLKEIHTATHPGARLARVNASPATSPNSDEDLAEASAPAPTEAAREELLSALAAEAAEEEED
jgi:integrase/recombinase XerD